MNLTVTVNHKQLLDVLLNIGLIRPVFIWGAPGIGKSAIVQDFADSLGLPCVSLLGSQLAPEDIIGVPQIRDGYSVFCPPRTIARQEPYVLFLDELNACTSEVQKAFYSLIHERRIGEYSLPEGSIVVGAGNRAQDNAITRPMSSALVNRMFHVELTASPSKSISSSCFKTAPFSSDQKTIFAPACASNSVFRKSSSATDDSLFLALVMFSSVNVLV